jgi:hypothetical protein
VLYATFCSWYTSCDGPLTDQEVEHFLALVAENNPNTDPERREILRAFLESDTGDDFVMLNVIEMRKEPLRIEGVAAGDTSADVLAKYMEHMTPELFRRACHPVLYGTAAAGALEMSGIEDAREWTVGAGMRYRSRRDMLEIATNPAFQGPHEFKLASMNKTFAFPIDPWLHLGDPRLLLALFLLVIGLAVSTLSARQAR